MKGLYLSGLLTGLLLQYDFGHCTELSLLWYTVGHIEIETLRHHQLVLGLLVLSAAHDLLLVPQHLHLDGSVPVVAFGLADVDELHVCLVLAGQSDDPGYREGRPHTLRPVGGGQQGRRRHPRTNLVNNCLLKGMEIQCQHCILRVNNLCWSKFKMCIQHSWHNSAPMWNLLVIVLYLTTDTVEYHSVQQHDRY